MIDQKIFDILKKMALTVEPVARTRFASAVVYRKDVVAFGINQKKSHPFMIPFTKNEDAIFLHAEVDAIKNALKEMDDLSRCSLYVLRIKKDNDRKTNICGLAKPCIGCMRAISTFGIKNVKYTLDNSGYGVL